LNISPHPALARSLAGRVNNGPLALPSTQRAGVDNSPALAPLRACRREPGPLVVVRVAARTLVLAGDYLRLRGTLLVPHRCVGLYDSAHADRTGDWVILAAPYGPQVGQVTKIEDTDDGHTVRT